MGLLHLQEFEVPVPDIDLAAFSTITSDFEELQTALAAVIESKNGKVQKFYQQLKEGSCQSLSLHPLNVTLLPVASCSRN